MKATSRKLTPASVALAVAEKARKAREEPLEPPPLPDPSDVQERPLAASRVIPEAARARMEGLPLEELARGETVLRVRSKVLGEDVLFVPDGHATHQGDLVAYTAGELEVLIKKKAPADVLRAVHEMKRTFRGRVVENAEHGGRT